MDPRKIGMVRYLGMPRFHILILLVATIALGGCAAFREGRVESVTDWPPPARPPGPSIRLVPTGVIESGGRRANWKRGQFASWTAALRRACESSGYFSDVRFQPADTDLVADVRILNRGASTGPLAYLTGLTLGVIPAWAEEDIRVTTTFTDSQGRSLGTFEKSEKVTAWFHLFMLFAMPGRQLGVVFEQVKQDLFRGTLIEADSMGIFEPRETDP